MPSQHIPVTGGCLCGAVRYESKDPPIQGFYCHCTICQRSYGGLFQATVKFTRSALQFTKGEVKLSLQQIHQAGLLLRLRFADSVPLRRKPECLDTARLA